MNKYIWKVGDAVLDTPLLTASLGKFIAILIQNKAVDAKFIRMTSGEEEEPMVDETFRLMAVILGTLIEGF